MSDPTPHQQQSQVGGHQAGGDIDDSSTTNVYINAAETTPHTRVAVLLAKLREEIASDEQCQETLASLLHYVTPVDASVS